MLKKHVLSTLVLLASSTLYANNIPIEMLSLTQKGSSVTGTSSSNLNWQLMQKNQELETDVRHLRGLLEEQDNEISKLKNELSNRYIDLDQRLELLYQKVDPEYVSLNEATTATTATPSTTTTNTTSTASTAVASVAANPATAVGNLPSYNVHNLNSNQTQANDAAKTAYNAVLEILKTDGPKSTISPMLEFIKKYPDSIYTSSAYFGVAEFHFTSPSNYAEAKKYFDLVLKNYPNSPRAPRSVVRLYDIALNVDKDSAAAEEYKKILLNNYASSEEAITFSKAP